MITLKLDTLSVLQFLVGISLSQSQECNVYPSEYAYHEDSVNRAETASANCRNYPSGLTPQDIGIFSKDHIHCNGTQLRLTDSDLGKEQYSSSYYYEWSADTVPRQLLFIFPTRVNLTTITLHYYNDRQRGLPRLKFYAAPDDFDVWKTPPGNSRYADIAAVAPGAESAGRRNVSFNVNFSTSKTLMVKFSSNFKLAVSEVEFVTCNGTPKVTTEYTTQESSVSTTAMAEMIPPTKEKHNMPNTTNTTVDYGNISITSSYSVTVTENTVGTDISTSNDALKVGIGIIMAIATLLTTVLVLIAVVIFARKSTKQKRDYDSPYSVLRRGTTRQLQPVDNNTRDMYDQIKLSPLTGQAEFVSNIETGNTSSNMQRQRSTSHSVEINQPKIASSPQTTDKHIDNTEHATYAVVNKKKKNKLSQKAEVHSNCESATRRNANGQSSLEELYTVVKKKTKCRAAKEDENDPPVPPHTVEELYTAVNKIQKVRAATKEEEAPPIPPHTVEELYTAVNKTPKGNAADDEEEAPPIPPHIDEDA